MFNNVKALLGVQIINQILPLLLVPYLAKVLKVELYGVVSFGLGLISLAAIFTDYGFNLYVTLKISLRREKISYVNRLVGAVFLSKLVLLLIVVPIISSYILFADKYTGHTVFFLLMIFPLTAQTFLPIWFFQGIEKLTQFAWINLIAKVLYAALIFIFVRAPEDYIWIPLANGLSQTIATCLAIGLLIKYGYHIVWPGIAFTCSIVRRSTEFFWSRAAVSTYTAGAAVFLGIFSTANQVAYYAAAEQIYRGAQGLLNPLSQALYPNIVRTHNFPLLFKVTKWASVVCFTIFVCAVFVGQWLISILFGQSFVEGYIVLLILLLTLTINTPSVLLGYPLLGALGHAGVVNWTVLYAGVMQLCLLILCLHFHLDQAFHIAITIFIVEIFVLSLRIFWGQRFYKEWIGSKRQE